MPNTTIGRAIEALKQGRPIVIVDDETRENEGDVVLAASTITAEQVNFLMTKARGLICAALAPSVVELLKLQSMVEHPQTRLGTAFLQSVDVKERTTTGISAHDRAKTLRRLADPSACREDFFSPGHIFPLAAAGGGIVERRGHTEASVDMVHSAGMGEVAVICEVASQDGTMARGEVLQAFARRHRIPLVSIQELFVWRVRNSTLIEEIARTRLPTAHGMFECTAYRFLAFSKPIIVLRLKGHGGVTGGTPLVRIESECLTGHVFGSYRCDCKDQIEESLRRIGHDGQGVLFYLPQEGRGIGLVEKLRAYALQDQGLDTVEANQALGHPVDARDYAAAAQVLRAWGIERVVMLTNNPQKVEAMGEYGITVVRREGVTPSARAENVHYLKTKNDRLGHWLKDALEAFATGINRHYCPRRIPASYHSQFLSPEPVEGQPLL